MIGGVVGLIIVVLGLILSVVWLIFPFIVIGRFDRMAELSSRQNELLQRLVHMQEKTNPEAAVNAKPSMDYMEPPSSKAPLLLLGMAAVIGIVVIIAWLAK